MLKSCSIHPGTPGSCRMRPSSSLASTWITVQDKPRRGSTGKESDGLHLAEETLDLDAVLEAFAQAVTTPVSRGSRSPKLRGVLVWVERNSHSTCGLLECCHSE